MNVRQRRSRAHRGQRGFTMFEILVTLFLLTMWLLASAGVQSSSLQFTKAAQFRTQAIYLATDIAERMEANSAGAIAGAYAIAPTVVTAPGTLPNTCFVVSCAPTALATFDKAEWTGRVYAAGLPNASVTVSTAGAANPITYTILISWSDRRTDGVATGTTETLWYTATKTIFNRPS